MKKILALTSLLLLVGCNYEPVAVTSEDIDAQEAVSGEAQGDAETVGQSDISPDEEASSAEASVASFEAPTSAQPEPLTQVRTTLVDQDYTGIAGVKGLSWVKAIGAKKITGDSSFGNLEITLSRNGNEKGIDALGLYVAPLDEKGQVFPSLEWRHVRYIDAVPLNNTRALAVHPDGLSTIGVESVTKVYDLSQFPTQKECDFMKTPAFCPDGEAVHDLLNAFRDYSLYIGFLPSRSTAHVKVVLVHDGGLSVTDAVK